MNAGARLAAFGVLLVAVFATALLVGGAAGSDVDPPPRAETEMEAPAHDAHGGGSVKAKTPEAGGGRAAGLPGLAVADRGLRLELAERSLELRRRSSLRFRVVGQDGAALTDFEVEHEKRMHLIVVRRDFKGFQHLHPTMADDGTWTAGITLTEAGAYRVFADFAVDGGKRTLASDLTVDGPATYRPLVASKTYAGTPGGFEVRVAGDRSRAGRASTLAFSVFRSGAAVRTDPYLGAGGHLVALRDGDLAFLHTHPAERGNGGGADDDAVSFETTFPSVGRYRLFFQFKVDGRVETAEFTQEVTR